MSQKQNTLHIARLKNNCPTCFGSEELEFTFTQNENENVFFHRPSTKIEETLYCHNCKNIIYPVNWNQDIERVYDYNKKIAETKRRYLKVKPLFYILIIASIIVVATIIYIMIF